MLVPTVSWRMLGRRQLVDIYQTSLVQDGRHFADGLYTGRGYA